MKVDNYCILPNTKLTDALQIIDENRGSALFVIDNNKKLIGAVSDGDIRRWILKGEDITAEVEGLMNRNPQYVYKGKENQAKLLIQEMEVNAVPVVDDDGKVIDIVFDEKYRKTSIKDSSLLKDIPVVIMAGGKGTRLYPYTKILPKPLIPIGDVPIVERVIDEFYSYGVNKIYMTVNYKKNIIQSYFLDLEKPYNIEYVEEGKPLGTAGSLKLIVGLKTDALFVTNSDSLTRIDYEALYREHISKRNDITIVAAIKNESIPYGVITSNIDGKLKNIEEKPVRSYLINTGMYVINSKMIDLIPKDTMFHMTDLIESAKRKKYKIGVYPVGEDTFLDMGEFAEMKRMEEKLDLI